MVTSEVITLPVTIHKQNVNAICLTFINTKDVVVLRGFAIVISSGFRVVSMELRYRTNINYGNKDVTQSLIQ